MGKGGKGSKDGAVEEVQDGQERQNWSNPVEFVLTLVGFAVGLGNVWRFPYLAFKNGGGAFLIPYFLMLIFLGIPIFYMEVAFGQFASKGPFSVWAISPIFRGLGYAMVMVNTLTGIYYNVIIAWCLYYFFASLNADVPWRTCDNWWNSRFCRTTEEFRNLSGTPITNDSVDPALLKTASEEYYYDQVLRLSDGIDYMGNVRWQLALCLLVAWTIIFLVLIKGISSLGKVVYFSSLFPYVLLTIMLIQNATLEGASLGIEYYLKPDFNKLLSAETWSDAAVQIFYSTSACTGGLIAMASFNPFHSNCRRDSILVPIIDSLTGFYAGFVIFCVLGYMATMKGVAVADVAASGPGLVFAVYPEGLATMPIAPLWSALFFFMLAMLGFSSEFAITEVTFSALFDEFPVLRYTYVREVLLRAGIIIVYFLLGLPMVTEGGFYMFSLVDHYIGGYPLLIIGVFEVVCLQYTYGITRFREDIAMMIGVKPGIYFKAMWLFFTPLVLMGVIIFMCVGYEDLTLFDSYHYPPWAMAIAWLIVTGCLVWIPLWAIFYFFYAGGCQVLRNASRPTAEWGPANERDRTGIYALPKADLTGQVLYTAASGDRVDGSSYHKGYYNAAFSEHDKV